jgi:hypothetical protein
MHTHYRARVTRFDVHIDSLGVDRGGELPIARGLPLDVSTGCLLV